MFTANFVSNESVEKKVMLSESSLFRVPAFFFFFVLTFAIGSKESIICRYEKKQQVCANNGYLKKKVQCFHFQFTKFLKTLTIFLRKFAPNAGQSELDYLGNFFFSKSRWKHCINKSA